MGKNPDEVPKTQTDSPHRKLLVPGRRMPADCSCRITPHSYEVYSSTFVKCTQRLGRLGRLIKKESRCARSVCLVLDLVCISSSTNNNVIKYVVDTAKEPLHLSACDLSVGSLVITLPEHKLPEWKEVTGRQLALTKLSYFACMALYCRMWPHNMPWFILILTNTASRNLQTGILFTKSATSGMHGYVAEFMCSRRSDALYIWGCLCMWFN